MMKTTDLRKIFFMPVLVVTGFLVLVSVCNAQDRQDTISSAAKLDTLKKYGIDPGRDISSRVMDTSPEIILMFQKAGMSPRRHELSGADRVKIAKAFAALPALHQRVLKERLHSISFLDNMPNTALTSTFNPGSPYRLYDITFRAAILNQTVSQWTTEKENTLFKADQQASVTIDAGALDAILYVIFHETTHVVDAALGLTEDNQTAGTKSFAPFTNRVWTSRMVTVPEYTDSLLQAITWKKEGNLINVTNAVSLYKSLQKTPFVSIYSSCSRMEDLAEYLSVYHLTQKLRQPFRIMVHQNGKEDFVYEPMKSKLVRSRIGQMQQFYLSKT
ncbi:MAG: hypothetical protein ABWY16_11015 [Pedobacter sp.]|uniref:hypothetical protein n=1 Tax=Pedobacter sp. TaxID=1411316 RepID=UPI0033995CC4